MAKLRPCRSCGSQIRMVPTNKGRWIPLNPDPDLGGNVRVVGGVATVLAGVTLLEAQADRRGALYRTHFSTCPTADQHRRRAS